MKDITNKNATDLVRFIDERINEYCKEKLSNQKMELYNSLMAFKYSILGYIESHLHFDSFKQNDKQILAHIELQNTKVTMTDEELEEMIFNVDALISLQVPFSRAIAIIQNKFKSDFPFVYDDFIVQVYRCVIEKYAKKGLD